jgi:hypothetical protein
MVLLQERQCFFLSLNGAILQNMILLPLENTEWCAVYLSIHNSFSLRNNVRDPPHSHFESFHERHTLLVPFSGFEVFGTQVKFLSFGKTEM